MIFSLFILDSKFFIILQEAVPLAKKSTLHFQFRFLKEKGKKLDDGGILGVISLDNVEIPSPKKVINIFWIYKKLQCKGELYWSAVIGYSLKRYVMC